MEKKDGNHGLDIWHMECSDHATAREDDGDQKRDGWMMCLWT
jgi:hypothetical protein